MSTQLILYPQNYVGVYDISYAYGFNEYIINGQNFIGLNQTTDEAISATGLVSQQAIYQLGGFTPGTWYRFHTIGPTWNVTTAPTKQAGNVLFPITSTGTTGKSGFLQLIYNLTVGVLYEISIKNASPLPNGTIRSVIYQLNGNPIAFADFVNPMYLTYTHTFVAQATSMIYAVTYESSVQTHIMKTLSIKEKTAVQTGITSIDDGQVICDLYEEEDIPLTLSIDDFKNVAEQVKSYSKDFNLPATKRNNRIFNNMFEVTRADDGLIFNPYVKTKCVLKQDGFILFEGYLRLIDVKDDEGEISYNVNLYSEVVALADTLKDLTFSDLDFSELTHDYNYSEIRNSWQGILGLTNPLPSGSFAGVPGASVTSVLRYPNIDWNHQFYPDASGNPVLPNLESMFRPCIQLKYLINRIFANTSFNWTSNFFDSADFEKLYMDFNWGGDNFPVTFNKSGIAFTLVDQIATASFTTLVQDDNNYPAEMGYSAGVYTAIEDGQTYVINPDFAFYEYQYSSPPILPFTYIYRWKMVKGGVTSYINVTTITGNGNSGWQFGQGGGTITETLNTGDTLTPEFQNNNSVTHEVSLQTNNFLGGTVANTSTPAVTSSTLLQTLRGELGQWDFLKGIMTMFNLVSLVDEDNPNNILIEPYSDVFINNTNSGNIGNLTLAARSIQHDWTDKVDISQMELVPLTDLNKITNFKFVEDDDDYAFNVYKNSTSGHLYGSKKLDASLSATNNLPTVLQGTKEIIAEPFAATVSKPLMSQYSDFVVPSLYAMSDATTSEGFDNSPRIFYNNGFKTLTSCTYFVPAQNGQGATGLEDDFLQFSHLSTIPSISATTTDFVFESKNINQLGLGSAPTDNLYSMYWQPYFNELYNADTRFMTLKVNLTPSDISTFEFYDTVFIKNRVFRVNKIEYKPNSLATVEFILIP